MIYIIIIEQPIEQCLSYKTFLIKNKLVYHSTKLSYIKLHHFKIETK